MRRQHAPALNVVCLLDFAERAGVSRGLDLRKLRQIGVAQHQADVGMGDEPPCCIDYVRPSALADFDLGYHVPDEFEIDLGNADAGVASRTC